MERPFLLLLDEVDIHLHPAWQRKVLPIVQRVFPKAQIIASTHSPFVVASAKDAHIISLKLENGVSSVESNSSNDVGVSYSKILRSIFGIETDFDVETEQLFKKFHDAKKVVLNGQQSSSREVEKIAEQLASASEEVKELVAIELRQFKQQQRLKEKAS